MADVDVLDFLIKYETDANGLLPVLLGHQERVTFWRES